MQRKQGPRWPFPAGGRAKGSGRRGAFEVGPHWPGRWKPDGGRLAGLACIPVMASWALPQPPLGTASGGTASCWLGLRLGWALGRVASGGAGQGL
jgi:hypothetical protein